MRLAIAANANIVTHALSHMEMCKAKQICHTFLMRSCDAVNVDEHWDLVVLKVCVVKERLILCWRSAMFKYHQIQNLRLINILEAVSVIFAKICTCIVDKRCNQGSNARTRFYKHMVPFSAIWAYIQFLRVRVRVYLKRHIAM